MRAAEFLRGLADMIDAMDDKSSNDSIDAKEKDTNPVMVPPLQQHIELAKAEQGKDSEVIQKLTRSEHR
jgi:hypothetical protein